MKRTHKNTGCNACMPSCSIACCLVGATHPTTASPEWDSEAAATEVERGDARIQEEWSFLLRSRMEDSFKVHRRLWSLWESFSETSHRAGMEARGEQLKAGQPVTVPESFLA